MLVGFFILLSLFYLSDSSEQYWDKKPAVMVINIGGEIVTTNFFGIYEKRGQDGEVGTSSTNIVRMLQYSPEDDSIKHLFWKSTLLADKPQEKKK